MKTFVIGDVHGNIGALKKLIDKAAPSKADQVIQVGDLGNFVESSREDDFKCFDFALEHGINVLWGNHEFPCAMKTCSFHGFYPPLMDTLSRMLLMNMEFWVLIDKFLISHAGLSRGFTTSELFDSRPTSDVITSISRSRGGWQEHGGILWRDAAESLNQDFLQIFGHTPHKEPMQYGDSWCIDVGCKHGDNLAGIWLPSMELVTLK